jgi:copper chaperone CopZ
MTTITYAVTGLTCGHCANAVTEELSCLDGVRSVDVGLVPGGESKVVVTSEAGLTDEAVAAALDEAGDYTLARTIA